MSTKIDEIIKRKFQEDNYIPNSTKDAINDILKQNRNIVIDIKPNKSIIFKKLVTVMASLMVVFIGSISTYAAFGGTISGKPIIEWLGIKFSDEYENYKVGVEGQEVIYKETKVELSSTVCDDGFVIFEFDVNLSKEDKEYLRLGETLVSEEELKEAEQEALKEEQEEMGGYYQNYDARGTYKNYLQGRQLINTIRMVVNDICIDGESYYTKSTQTTTKISDYEYKVYQLYFLTDEIIKDKTDFSVTLTLNALENTADKSGYKKLEDTKGFYIINTPNNQRTIDMTGEFVVEVSKDKALENTEIIIPDCEKVKYRNMTKTIEEVRITPLQIIAKVKTVRENLSLQALSSTMNKDYVGITDFNVYDNLGSKLESLRYETKRTITYANGKVEEWAPGDIGTFKSFYNAKMELIEYIIIEKPENIDNIKIVPTVRELNFKDEGPREKTVELNPLEINLKQ